MVYTTEMKYFCLKIQMVQKEVVSYAGYPGATFLLKETNVVTQIATGEGWREERTGLHENEYIETRRRWFTDKAEHDTQNGVSVINVMKGDELIVESPDNQFEPFIVHYAETYIVPACVGKYSIRLHGQSKGNYCGTLKAYVRFKE